MKNSHECRVFLEWYPKMISAWFSLCFLQCDVMEEWTNSVASLETKNRNKSNHAVKKKKKIQANTNWNWKNIDETYINYNEWNENDNVFK